MRSWKADGRATSLGRRSLAVALICAVMVSGMGSQLEAAAYTAQYSPDYVGRGWKTVVLLLAIVPVAVYVAVLSHSRLTSPSLKAEPRALEFDSVPREGHLDRTVVVSTRKRAGLDLRAVRVTGGCFSLPEPPELPRNLVAGEELKLVVRMSSTRAGGCSGSLEVTGLDRAKPRATILRVPMKGKVSGRR